MMKIFVDEMPKRPEDCLFSERYTYVCTCKLSEYRYLLESCICSDTTCCPYLKVLEEER